MQTIHASMIKSPQKICWEFRVVGSGEREGLVERSMHSHAGAWERDNLSVYFDSKGISNAN